MNLFSLVFNYKIKSCYRIYKNKLFENIILTVIVLTSLKLVLDTYITEESFFELN